MLTGVDETNLPQTLTPKRSEYVNVRSMAVREETDTPCTDRLDTIFRAQYERIARVIGRVIHDQARAEELAVEVFLKWWRHAQAHGEGAEGWLYRTAVREALDELRRHSRRNRFERLLHIFRESPPTPEHLCSVADRQRNVRAVLAVLKPAHAEILLLRSEGLSYQELAAALNLAPNYVGSFLRRAQDAFRKEYIKRYGNQSE